MNELEFFGVREARVIASARGRGPGFWAGPGQGCWDADSEAIVLPIRYRCPRGGSPGERGAFLRLCTVVDYTLRPVWMLTKSDVSSRSLEMAALRRTAAGRWELLVSRDVGYWRIDALQCDEPGRFDLGTLEPALLPAWTRAGGLGTEYVVGVKDPVLLADGSMLASTFEHDPAPAPTYLAVPDKGVRFRSVGMALPVGAPGAWDDRQRRITAVIPLGADDGLLAFYDGGRLEDDCREHGGVAWSAGDVRGWQVLTETKPLLNSAYGKGSCRYVSAVETPDRWFLCCESEDRPVLGETEGAHRMIGGYTTIEELRHATRLLRSMRLG